MDMKLLDVVCVLAGFRISTELLLYPCRSGMSTRIRVGGPQADGLKIAQAKRDLDRYTFQAVFGRPSMHQTVPAE
jgi:hypothetical protein